MKATGITRRLDELGRIVLPKSIREEFEIHEKDPVETYTDEDKIILKKYLPACIFCGTAEDVIYFREKRVCQKCLQEIKNNF